MNIKLVVPRIMKYADPSTVIGWACCCDSSLSRVNHEVRQKCSCCSPQRSYRKHLHHFIHRRVAHLTMKMKMNDSLHAFDFERQFDDRVALEWFQQNWRAAFVLSGLYALVICVCREFMKHRPKLDLRTPLVFWSLSLALFSVAGAMRTSWYMFSVLTTHGFRQSVCDTHFYSDPVSKFWAFAFALSKAPELGDTVFIVLRKQRLIFLHWYHHITVLLYSWYSYKDHVAGGSWFMTLNYSVHAFMYSYYTARAAGVRVPKPFAVLITLMQMCQMLAGLGVLALVHRWKHDVNCVSTTNNIFYGSAMYLSYLLLFSRFFYLAYLRPRDKRD